MEEQRGIQVWWECPAEVSAVSMDRRGSAVAASSLDSTINIWDVRSHVLRQRYARAHGGCPISGLEFHPQRDLLLSSSADRTLRIWDLRAGKLWRTVTGHSGAIKGCAWTDGGNHFVSCDGEVLHIWESSPRGFAGVASASPPRRTAVPAAEPRPETSGLVQNAAVATPGTYQNHEPVQEKGWTPEVLHQVYMQQSVGHSEITQPSTDLDLQHPEVCEAAARLVEGLVSQMGTLSHSLEAFEARLQRVEGMTADVGNIIHSQRKIT